MNPSRQTRSAEYANHLLRDPIAVKHALEWVDSIHMNGASAHTQIARAIVAGDDAEAGRLLRMAVSVRLKNVAIDAINDEEDEALAMAQREVA